MNSSCSELNYRPQGEYSHRFRTSCSVSRLWACEDHRRFVFQGHTEWSGNRNGSVERTGMLAPGNVWVWKKVSKATTVKEHGYLRARNDGIRGEHLHNTSITPSELMI